MLHGVSMTIPAGAIHTVVGKNGMGKTTLLRTIMGLLPAKSGSVKISGQEVAGQPAYRVARLGVSYVPQETALFQDLTVEDNLRLGLRDRTGYGDRLAKVCDAFPFLGSRLRQRAGTLSGGEQKMLLISRALMSQPRLMLVDEISEGLQPLVISKLREALSAERESHGLAILLVEQNAAFAFSLADEYAVLKLGEVVARGKTGDEKMREITEGYIAL